MPGREDQVFPGWALAVVLFLGPVVVLLGRRRWKLAEARREVVMNLATLAAEESERAEIEACWAYAAGYAPTRDVGRPSCAVCLSPTTTRCSRCKAVRYCSGKCQIIHWRQGHKHECRSPGCSHQSDQMSFTDVKGGHGGKSDDLFENGESQELGAKPVNIFLERPSPGYNCGEILSKDDNLENSVRASEVESAPGSLSPSSSISSSRSSSSLLSSPSAHSSSSSSSSPSSTISSSCSTLSGLVEASCNAYLAKDSLLQPHIEVGETLSSDSSCTSSKISVGMSQVKVVQSSPSHFVCGSSSVHSVSGFNESEQKVVGPVLEKAESKEDIPCRSSSIRSTRSNVLPPVATACCQEVSHMPNLAATAQDDSSVKSQIFEDGGCFRKPLFISTKGSPLDVSARLSGQVREVCEKTYGKDSPGDAVASEITGHPEVGNATSCPNKSNCATSEKRMGKIEEPRSTAPAYHVDVGLSASNYTGPKIEKPPIVPGRSLSMWTSELNDDDDLKTPKRKAVEQYRSFKFSRNYSSDFESDISSKEKYEMVFPYDLFIKLYNSDKVALRPCGLVNCGNSCYANAVLQCLAFTRPLSAYLLEGLHVRSCPRSDWCFMCELESLLQKAKLGKSPLSPVGILSHIQNISSNLCRGREEDAHEFLRFTIDIMQSVCLKEAGKKSTGPLAEEITLIQLVFGGYLRSKIKCLRCQGKSERHERMMDLTVEIHGDIGSLEEALLKFTASEVLDGDNKYKCNRCKSYERAKKKLTVSEAPNILTIALKRFQSGKFGKVNKVVRFPEYLNLAPYMSGTDDKFPVYRLYAVVVHLDTMDAAFSGHYVCFVKSTQGKWYKVDDNKVNPVELEMVLSETAYMLLYARCSPRAPSLLRKVVSHDHPVEDKAKAHDIPGKREIPKARSAVSPSLPRSPVAQKRSQHHPRQTAEEPAKEPFENFDKGFIRHVADSSSDSSSLFSCSDEGSWCTESSRNSTSTEEYSDYIFGESSNSERSSPYRFLEDSDGFTFLPSSVKASAEATSTSNFSHSRQEDNHQRKGLSYELECMAVDGLGGKINLSVLNADPTNICRKLTGQSSSSNSSSSSTSSSSSRSDADLVNRHETKSTVRLRNGRERTTQALY